VHAGLDGGAEAGEDLVGRAGAVDVGDLPLLAVFLDDGNAGGVNAYEWQRGMVVLKRVL
jgi:hypothetical protein